MFGFNFGTGTAIWKDPAMIGMAALLFLYGSGKFEIMSKNLITGKFLELGTGPGTQAIQLAKRNFEVAATDISSNAIKNAKKLSNKIHFLTDDILNSQLLNHEFDFIFDRGIFHVFDISQRPQYVKQIKRILDNNGILFLKCMSVDEKNISDNDLAHKLSKQEIVDIFNDDFDIESIDNSVFHGTLAIKLKALFAVLKKNPYDILSKNNLLTQIK